MSAVRNQPVSVMTRGIKMSVQVRAFILDFLLPFFFFFFRRFVVFLKDLKHSCLT